MYRDFADVAAFYVVYIREAHPADSDRSEPLARRLQINQPKTYLDRREVARQCVVGLKIAIPCLIDDMENTTEKAYGGWPDRLYVVGQDGRIALAGARGPRGFRPQDVRKWLTAYKEATQPTSRPTSRPVAEARGEPVARRQSHAKSLADKGLNLGGSPAGT
jgi:hypothetical protein